MEGLAHCLARSKYWGAEPTKYAHYTVGLVPGKEQTQGGEDTEDASGQEGLCLSLFTAKMMRHHLSEAAGAQASRQKEQQT